MVKMQFYVVNLRLILFALMIFCLKMLNNNIHINMVVDQCGHRKLQTGAYATFITNKSP